MAQPQCQSVQTWEAKKDGAQSVFSSPNCPRAGWVQERPHQLPPPFFFFFFCCKETWRDWSIVVLQYQGGGSGQKKVGVFWHQNNFSITSISSNDVEKFCLEKSN